MLSRVTFDDIKNETNCLTNHLIASTTKTLAFKTNIGAYMIVSKFFQICTTYTLHTCCESAQNGPS